MSPQVDVLSCRDVRHLASMSKTGDLTASVEESLRTLAPVEQASSPSRSLAPHSLCPHGLALENLAPQRLAPHSLAPHSLASYSLAP